MGIVLPWLLLLPACDGTSAGSIEENPLARPPIDPAVVSSADETLRWEYRQTLETDLDADEAVERLTLTADVVVGSDGTPLWEDGHRWAAYVDEPEGRTLVYSAFVPNGFAEAAVAVADGDGSRAVLILERTPTQLRVLEIDYVRPGVARLATAGHYPLQSWLPGGARLR